MLSVTPSDVFSCPDGWAVRRIRPTHYVTILTKSVYHIPTPGAIVFPFLQNLFSAAAACRRSHSACGLVAKGGQ
jgi:hypothetical protein